MVDNGMSKMSSGIPQITGISPKEGAPGTLVTLRGENLGNDASDLLALFICGTDCVVTAKWKSPSKIVARVGQAKRGAGDILLITKSGGKGISNVQFRVFVEEVNSLQESAVWVDESRTVPGRNVVRAVQDNEENEDALGFPINEKKSLDNSYLSKLFPDYSGNLRVENFSPAWYLLQHHKDSDIDKLRQGVENMKKKMKGAEERGKDRHKANLYSLINCVDALDSLHSKVKIEKNTRGWPLTSNLHDKVSEAKTTADKLFLDVLSRKDNADSTRNALSVLNRFRVIFFLSSKIDENIKKGEYSTILNEYARTKALFKDTDVSLFKEAMEVVDEKMRKFKNSLKHKLIDKPASFEEQNKLIKCLKILDPNSDPAWDAISSYHVYLEDILFEVQEKYYRLSIEEHERHSEGLVTVDGLSSTYTSNSNPRQQFCVELMNVLNEKLLMFWKLAQSYTPLDESQYSEKQADINQMITNTINCASWLLWNALVPQALPENVVKKFEDQFVEWEIDREKMDTSRQLNQLIFSIQTIRNCIKNLFEAQFMKSQMETLMGLCTTIRINCINHLVKLTNAKIIELHSKESWKTDVVLEKLTKTSLPDLYENEIYDTLSLLKQLISHDNYQGEADLTSEETLRQVLLDLLLQNVLSIKECFEIALDLQNNSDLKRPNRLQVSDGNHLRSSINSIQSDSQMSDNSNPIKNVSLDKRSIDSTETFNQSGTSISYTSSTQISSRKLLIVICNLEYIITQSITGICKRYRDSGVKHVDYISEKAKQRLNSFRQSLLKLYLNLKTNNFYTLLDSSSYEDPPEDDISEYVKEVILGMIFVKADLLLLAPQIINVIMVSATTNTLEKLISKIPSPDKLDNFVTTQYVIDLTAIEEAFQQYLTVEMTSKLNCIRADMVPKIDQERFQYCLKKYRDNMAMAITSLQITGKEDDEISV
uniref:Exocyst complex component 2 n=1 Tax=Parastrongyloides trichosuri TaxID=131310 RepID=A0A0N4ZV59_PARTI